MKKGVASRVAVFLLLAGGFTAAAVAIPRITYHFARLQPDNYRFIALQALRAGDYAHAATICRSRLESNTYDFEAHYLLAEALARGGDPAQAAATAKEVLRKVPAAMGKKGGATGYDEARTYQVLASSLWQGGRWEEAGEMGRAALDCGTAFTSSETSRTIDSSTVASPDAAPASARFAMKADDRGAFERALAIGEGTTDTAVGTAVLRARWLDEKDNAPLAAETLLRGIISTNPLRPEPRVALRDLLGRHGWAEPTTSTASRADLTTGVRSVPLDSFQRPEGATLSGGVLDIGRNGTVSARIGTGVFKVTNLLLNASGTEALGLYPVLVVREGERELARLYLDSQSPRPYDLRLWPDGAPRRWICAWSSSTMRTTP